MTVEEVFTKIAVHMVEGMMIHDQMSQAYDFLGLCGFAKCHAYHHMEETKGYIELVHYYSSRYHKLLTIKDIPKVDLIPQTWYKYTTSSADTNTKRQSTKDLMTKWVKWEQDTKQLYQQMYKELDNLGEIAAANKIKCYICAVDLELKNAEKSLNKLETIDYNIGTIISWQHSLHKKYKKLLG